MKILKKGMKKKVAPEELIKELEDKLTRTFAEMENQRRRYEKRKMMLSSMVVSILLEKL